MRVWFKRRRKKCWNMCCKNTQDRRVF